MKVFHLALLHVVGEADIVVRREQQAGAFALEPLANRCDFLRRGLLLGKKMVEPEHHERVGVSQNPFVNRQLVARLVDALEHGDRVAGCFAGNLLEAERGAVKKLQRAGDPLKELRSTPLRRLVGRPQHVCGLRSSSRSGFPSRRDRAGIPTGSSTSSRCSGGVCPACICGECGSGCRCAPVLECSWLFPYLFFVPQN